MILVSISHGNDISILFCPIISDLFFFSDFVEQEMRLRHPEGFEVRLPTAKKIHRGRIICLGPHHEWSADGHDKLSQIGFPIWGIRDVWASKWLGLWVIPNNRLKLAVGYLYLELVEELGGKSSPCRLESGCH